MSISKSVSRSLGARVVLVLASTVGLLASASGGAAASSFPAHQPDLMVGDNTHARCCLGFAIYEPWPIKQRLDDVTVEQGSHTVLLVVIHNMGTSKDRFRITGEGSYSGVGVRYLAGMTGTQDVTAAVADGYIVSNVKPREGSSAALRIWVTAPAATVGFVRTVRVIIRTIGTPHAMDAVSFTVTVVK